MNEILDRAAHITATTYRAAAAPALPRLDLYTGIHKALRAALGHVMTELGALDADNDTERERVLAGLDALLAQMASHLQHENDFVHAAIEARRPGAARETADDHLLHVDSIENLADEARALRHAVPAQRAAMALQLYRHFAAFVAENLTHMQIEESHNNAVLWALYGDLELEAIHDRLLASIAPAEMAYVASWMARGLTVPELAGMFGGMQGKAPPQAIQGLLDIMRAQMNDTRWAALARALGIAPAPGLIEA